jgi:DNA-binding LacI/PurR family transcriptional regulator
MTARVADVAQRAGVSVSTVSYALTGKRPISAKTRERVQRAIDELGYRPNAGARAIRTRTTDIIGMVIPVAPDVRADMQMRFVMTVLQQARTYGKNVLLLTSEDGINEVRNLTASATVDGWVAMEIQVHDPRVPVLSALSRPTVLIGTPADPRELPHVDFDFAEAGAVCARYLLDLGHRDIGYLGQSQQAFDREAGYAVRARDGALSQLSASGCRSAFAPVEPGPAGTAQALESLLSANPGTTGLIAYNEHALPHVLRRLGELGMRVPADMSVVTICPEDEATSLVPPVSGVALPVTELARLAVDQLMEVLHGAAPPPALLAPALTPRGSAGPPPRPTRRP